MQKFFHIIIEIIYWIAIFLSPVILFSAIAASIYISNENNFWLSVIVLSLGVVFGVLWAERIRKKYGCSRYMSKILSTPDISPDDDLQEKKNK